MEGRGGATGKGEGRRRRGEAAGKGEGDGHRWGLARAVVKATRAARPHCSGSSGQRGLAGEVRQVEEQVRVKRDRDLLCHLRQ